MAAVNVELGLSGIMAQGLCEVPSAHGSSREFSTYVLIEFLVCLGWIRVRQYPTAGGTSPSRKGAVLQPDHLPSHGRTLSHRL